jgi:hypothetical protein
MRTAIITLLALLAHTAWAVDAINTPEEALTAFTAIMRKSIEQRSGKKPPAESKLDSRTSASASTSFEVHKRVKSTLLQSQYASSIQVGTLGSLLPDRKVWVISHLKGRAAGPPAAISPNAKPNLCSFLVLRAWFFVFLAAISHPSEAQERRRVVGIPIHAKPNSKAPAGPPSTKRQAPSTKNQEPRTKHSSPPQRVDQLVQLIDDLLHIRLVWRVVGEEAERADAVGIGAGVVVQFGAQGRKGYLAGLAGCSGLSGGSRYPLRTFGTVVALGPSTPCGMPKVRCRVSPTTLTLTLAGSPGGRVVVASTCAAARIGMASISAFSPLSWLRICTASSGVPSWGKLGSNMSVNGMKLKCRVHFCRTLGGGGPSPLGW